MRVPTPPASALAALLAGAGTSHLVFPAFFDAMIPEALPGDVRSWTLGSAAMEMAVAGAVLVPATRRHGAFAAALLFASVLPANVKMAVDARSSDSGYYKLGTVLRLPLQIPLIVWALRVRRGAVHGSTTR